jgi:hypothetical protein
VKLKIVKVEGILPVGQLIVALVPPLIYVIAAEGPLPLAVVFVIVPLVVACR